jgi:ABC-type nitrate/sulfonate/bicarbonate transport system ATPase subunit
MMEQGLEFRDVSFSFGIPILDSCRFSLELGSLAVLLGPSGCGKSTLLRLASGFLRPASGTVLFGGLPVLSPGRSRFLIHQDADQLFPWKSVLANTALPLMVGPNPLAREEAEARAEKTLGMVGLAERKDDFPRQLSGGMKQRALLARALASDADLLLFDEPFVSLDAFSRETLQELLVELWHKSGKSILFVTHDIREAARIAKTIIFMHPNPGGARIEPLAPTGQPLRELETAEASTLMRELRRRFQPDRG